MEESRNRGLRSWVRQSQEGSGCDPRIVLHGGTSALLSSGPASAILPRPYTSSATTPAVAVEQVRRVQHGQLAPERAA